MRCQGSIIPTHTEIKWVVSCAKFLLKSYKNLFSKPKRKSHKKHCTQGMRKKNATFQWPEMAMHTQIDNARFTLFISFWFESICYRLDECVFSFHFSSVALLYIVYQCILIVTFNLAFHIEMGCWLLKPDPILCMQHTSAQRNETVQQPDMC